MASGYEQSPDYGGPEPNMRLIAMLAALVIAAVISAGVIIRLVQ